MFLSPARTASRFLNCLASVAALAVASTAYAQGFALTASPSALDFGDTLLGSAMTQTVTLSNLNNVGAAAVNVSQLALQSTPASFTRTGGTCPATPFALSSGASCTVELSFAPTVVGVQSASLQVVADTGNFTVAVSGTGIVAAPLPTFTPAQLNFGLFSPTGSTPMTQTVTISNPGSAPLALLNVAGAAMSSVTSDPYRIAGGSCVTLGSLPFYQLNTPLVAAGSCTLLILFHPGFASTAGNYDRPLVIQTGAGSVTIPMIASVGIPSQALSAAPNPLNFGGRVTGSTMVQSITFTNPGPAVANVQAIDLRALASITRSGGSCSTSYPFALSSGASCTVELSFAPTVVGVQSASLQVVADTGNFEVTVSGTGIVAAPLPTFAPAQLNFGLLPLTGATEVVQTVTLTNPGAAPLDLLGATGAAFNIYTSDNSYRVVDSSCVKAVTTIPYGFVFNTPLAAGASCTLSVAFYKSLAGNFDRSLVIQTGAGNVSIPMIASVGTLVYPIILTPAVITFEPAPELSDTRTVTFSNPAPVVARVSSFNLPAGFVLSGGTCPPVPFTLVPAASCNMVIARLVTTFSASKLKVSSYADVPVVASTGNANLRIEVAAQPLVNINFATQPPGLSLLLNGQTRFAPVTLQVEAGSNVTVEARAQNQGVNGYLFASWSDAGSAAHTVVAQNPGPALIATFSATPFVAKLDVDNDGQLNAATDGMLILRYLSGVRGAALVADLPVPANAERRDPAAIAAYLDAIRGDLDVDGVGGAVALTDGMLIIRYMFGLTGTALTQGTEVPGALTTVQIQNRLNSMRP